MGVRRASSTRYFCTLQFFEWWGLGRGQSAPPALGHKISCFVRLFLKVENNILTPDQTLKGINKTETQLRMTSPEYVMSSLLICTG